jgi:2-keto-4-pentenoate hydratase/2-oxohepta-3-ene-1,7-dioic acid hydratase in catechol pathway
MTHWIRYKYQDEIAFGTLSGTSITRYQGDMFNSPIAVDEIVTLDEVEVLIPCNPGKMLALWNNFHATMEKNNLPQPGHPWYFVKTPNTFAAAGSTIIKPGSCQGKILFEGELGIVIGKTCKEVSTEDSVEYIFGYTCINDVTALEHLFGEKSFDHWARGKCFDGFGVFGPTIATDIDPTGLIIETYLEGEERQQRQNYPVSDMIFSPYEIVSRLSQDMTLFAGDVIACGTSLGAGALKPGWQVEVCIQGVGSLVNNFSETEL